MEGGTVVTRDGRIGAAGAGMAVPADATIVDATGKWVAPGLVAGFSRVGLVEVDAVDPTNDTQANGSPFSAAIDIEPAINPKASAIAVRQSGRASCRERVGQYVKISGVTVSFKKK